MKLVSAPKKNQDISPEEFARFLARLAPDLERAGEEYEALRQMLVKFFECRRMAFAEDCADEVFNRVIRRLAEGEVIENLRSYCFSIARFILLEHLRSPAQRRIEWDELPPLTAPENEAADEDVRLACLRNCLQALPNESRDLIVEYYQDTKRAKLDVRQMMAARLGITRNALSNRMLRLRAQLEQCITRCVKKNAARIRQP